MTQEHHPVAPPDELVQKWVNKHYGGKVHRELGGVERTIATQATQWGYEQRGAVNEAELQKARNEELEACCEWLAANDWAIPGGECLRDLRAARRPKPPSLKEQALETLDSMRIAPVVINGINVNADVMNKYEIIRRAIESLPS